MGTSEGRAQVVTAVAERCSGELSGLVTCAGLAGAPSRAGSLLASVNYFGTVDLLVGLRPLLAPGGSGVATSAVAGTSSGADDGVTQMRSKRGTVLTAGK